MNHEAARPFDDLRAALAADDGDHGSIGDDVPTVRLDFGRRARTGIPDHFRDEAEYARLLVPEMLSGHEVQSGCLTGAGRAKHQRMTDIIHV